MRLSKTIVLSKTVLSVALCLLALAASLLPAAAQQPAPEKRIALVIGNSAYAKGPLATTANDAGLIAQTLQAAGFDVIGARDLDADTLRKSFRDFIHKAQSSDGNTVAMVYLAGYGLQLAGENYFIPVDANIGSDVDIPTEGLRLSDYVRQLAAIPLKAGVVVLDAARQQPFLTGGPAIAGGLALVEPDNNMLIAFNAAPGTIAPDETGSYGVYARSLAEMIRAGGLSLPEMFDRLRLRVNEDTKGAQVPWDAQKIQSAFTFFERAPDAPSTQASPEQTAALRARPIRELPVQEAYAAALERDSLQGYEDFIAAYPNDALARRVRVIVAARREALTWRRTYRTDSPEAYWSYLKRYPHGAHAEDARRRLAMLSAQPAPPPAFAMIDYDVPPPPPDEVVYVERPVLLLSDPEFGFVPPPPPPVYFLPPPPPEFVDLSPPYAPVGLFILPRPVFVPIPVYVRPPAFVAPPPNNIIYQNIHNTTVINTVINRPAPPAGPVATGPAAGTSPAVAPAPALPPAVAQRASLIQQGKIPAPGPLANPAGRPGGPQAIQANAPPGGPSGGPSPALGRPGQGPANGNALPVPGRGGPPVPPPSAQVPNPRSPASPSPAQAPPGRPELRASRTPPGAPAGPPTRPSATPSSPVMPAAVPRGPDARPRIQQAAPPVQPWLLRFLPPPWPPTRSAATSRRSTR
ncbi:caspase family protein, partial [Bradyrhizobium oligotrophicum]|uniref:caspase family protein n=1 Tax=Bradyrhizobium oligotrophicum TaxID=44255 RepID=UPI003EBF7563